MTSGKRSKITDLHRAEAAALKALWDSKPHRTQAEFGEAYGLGNQANVGHYLHARSALNPKAASAFASELQCMVADFSPRVAEELKRLSPSYRAMLADGLVVEGGPHDTSVVHVDDHRGPYRIRPDGRKTFQPENVSDEDFAKFRMSLADEAEVDHPVIHPSSNVNNVIRVPLLAIEASMGPGADLLREEEMVRSLSLSPQWISSALRPSRAEALRFIHGHGDSMFPTFNSGDVLLVDTDIADVSIPGVYVLEAQDQLFIKRVNRRLDGEYEITSDNPAHRTVEVLRGEHQVAVKGRVIWVWNGRKL